MKKGKLSKILGDVADAESSSFEKSIDFLQSKDVDINSFVLKGLKEVNNSNEGKKLSKSKSYFTRIVLAAEIAYKCYTQNTFGSVKFQKLIFLCEQTSEMPLSTSYVKQAAGPFDHKFMHTIANEFKRLNWFKVEKVTTGNFTKVNYTPLNKVENYKKYYNEYFSDEDEKIQYILSLFSQSKTKEVELVATIYACWKEIISQNMIFSNELIIKLVHNWAEEKKKFSENDISNKINWMKTKGLFPK